MGDYDVSARSLWAGVGVPPAPDEAGTGDFWQDGEHQARALASIASAHIATGVVGALAAGAIWWLVMGGHDETPAMVVPIALLLACAGAIALLVERLARRAALSVRVLLVLADLGAGVALLVLLGDRTLGALFLLVPIAMAATLFSWRSASAVAALALALFAGVGAIQLGTARLESWAPHTLALAAASFLIVMAHATGARAAAAGLARAAEELARQRQRLVGVQSAQQRLMEHLSLLQEAQLKLDQERVQINGQIAEVAGVMQRISDGDAGAVRSLAPGMYGPLDMLAQALARLGQQMSAVGGMRQHIAHHQHAALALASLVHEQSQALVAMDEALHDLSGRAHELVAEVQRAEGGVDLPSPNQQALTPALRGVEQQAIANASNTSLLGTRLAQVQARQAELEAQVLRLGEAHASTTGGLGARSGVHVGPYASRPSGMAGDRPSGYSGVHPFVAAAAIAQDGSRVPPGRSAQAQ